MSNQGVKSVTRLMEYIPISATMTILQTFLEFLYRGEFHKFQRRNRQHQFRTICQLHQHSRPFYCYAKGANHRTQR